MKVRRDTVLRRMIETRDLLSERDNWVQGASAVDAKGNNVPVESKEAVRFCATGAIARVCLPDRKRRHDFLIENTVERLVQAEAPNGCLVDLNDSSTPRARQRVLGCFNRAIKNLERELEQD